MVRRPLQRPPAGTREPGLPERPEHFEKVRAPTPLDPIAKIRFGAGARAPASNRIDIGGLKCGSRRSEVDGGWASEDEMGFCAPTGRRAQESRVFGVDDIGPNTMTPCDLSAACIDWAGRGVQFIGALARAGAGARECGGFAWGKLVVFPERHV